MVTSKNFGMLYTTVKMAVNGKSHFLMHRKSFSGKTMAKNLSTVTDSVAKADPTLCSTGDFSAMYLIKSYQTTKDSFFIRAENRIFKGSILGG